MKKLAVVGAGVSGMTAAIYCLKCGFDVTVYEKHSRSGGLCAGWERKGYKFEGALRWINDSAKTDPIYRLWHDTGILGDDVKIYRDDPYFVYYYKDTNVYLYRDIDKLKAHWLEIAPEDIKAIETLYQDIQVMRTLKIPLMDIPGLKTKNKNPIDIPLFVKMAPGLLKTLRLSKYSAKEYAAAFKHPGIRKILSEHIVREDFGSFSLLHTMACYMDSGIYPEGGSLSLGKRMEDKIKSLGGRIIFNTNVDKVIFEGRKACGLEIQGEKFPFNEIIITRDLLSSEELIGRPLKDKWIQAAKNDPPVQTTFTAIGVREDLRDLPYAVIFDWDITVGGIKYDTIPVTNYAGYAGFAPAGCSSLTCKFSGDSYAYWKEQKEKGSYDEKKQQIADELRKFIETRMPRLKDKIDVINIATPLTYERYTGSCKGAWMTVLTKGKATSLPQSISKSYKNLYFAGFRTKTPGGLPIALLSGFRAAQYACRNNGLIFESIQPV
jgi:phytoene dehydrogenase-like protein